MNTQPHRQQPVRGALVPATRLCLALGVLLSVLAGPAPNAPLAQAQELSSTRRVFVDAEDAVTLADLKAGGAKQLADYGSFGLWEISEATSQLLTNRDSVTPQDDAHTLALRGDLAIDTRTPQGAPPLPASLRQPASGGPEFWMVQFVGPIKTEWLDALRGAGLDIVAYLPNNAYVVWGVQARQTVAIVAEKYTEIQWQGAYEPGYRLEPGLLAAQQSLAPETLLPVTVQVYPTPNLEQTLAALKALGGSVLKDREDVAGFSNLRLELPASKLGEVAAWPDVFNVEPYMLPTKLDESQNLIISGNVTGNAPTPGVDYLAWLAARGFTQSQFTASGFVVDVADSGLDNATTTPNHFALYTLGDTLNASRVTYARLEGTPNGGSSLQGLDGHGTLNAHIIGGYSNLATGFPHSDANGFRYGLGVAPFVRLGSSVIFDPNTFTSPNFPNMLSRVYNSNGRISSNSWGAPVSGAYNSQSQAYDALVRDAQPAGSAFPAAGNQEMTIVFAAGNSGPGARTTGSPGTAKNVLTVGATEGVRAFGGPDGCSVPDAQADSFQDIATFSSRGPTTDGRVKPDLVAPGTHIVGGAFQAPSPGITGTVGAGFTGGGVCGGSVASAFFPAGQQWYVASSGTSHSTPAVSGGAALLRQWFINQGLSTPSPAMTKAFLMNSTRYLTGAGANDSLYSNNQGMGLLDLGRSFDGVPRILRDQTQVFGATGETATVTGQVANSGQPFRVTLAWTDAPGATTGNAFVNDLDLEVTVNGLKYRGNVFSGATSTPGGSADPRNNVESVFLPAGASGGFSVRVVARNIAGEGVPNNVDTTDQDFALVIYNGQESALAVPEVATVTAFESAGNGNGVIEPGEFVTMTVELTNVGTLTATQVSASHTPLTGSVTLLDNASPYPDLGLLATQTNQTPFRLFIRPDHTCGLPITLRQTTTFNGAQSAISNLTVPIGATRFGLAENFDALIPPNLPAGWTATTSGVTTAWAITNTVASPRGPDSAPNYAFAPNPATVTDNSLTTTPLSITTATAQLTFRNYYRTEAGSGATGFDGGVLEISLGGSVFTDVVSAGGSFVAGGYNRTISLGFGNPLAGRQAWSGDAGSYVTTVINLPAAAAGQSIQLRWRLGTDNVVSATGWWIDSIVLTDGFTCQATSGASVFLPLIRR